MIIKNLLFCGLAASSCLVFAPAQARPLSYPGGYMFMAQYHLGTYSLETGYTLTPHYGLSLENKLDNDEDMQAHMLNVNTLLWRGNYPDAQANIWAKAGAGYAFENGHFNEGSPAYQGALMADWENRRFYTAAEVSGFSADDIKTELNQSLRLGIAPYIGEAGNLHTWLIVEADHTPKREHEYSVTPLVRLFKGDNLAEFGISNHGEVLAHLTHQF